MLPGGQFFGILPKGTLLESPCRTVYLQLIEPPEGSEDIEWDERLLRIGLGTRNVPGAVRKLRERGVVFIVKRDAAKINLCERTTLGRLDRIAIAMWSARGRAAPLLGSRAGSRVARCRSGLAKQRIYRRASSGWRGLVGPGPPMLLS